MSQAGIGAFGDVKDDKVLSSMNCCSSWKGAENKLTVHLKGVV